MALMIPPWTFPFSAPTPGDPDPRQLGTTISKASRRERVEAWRQTVEHERTLGEGDGLSRVSPTAAHDVHGHLGKGTAVRANAGAERVELHDPADNRARLALQRHCGPRKDRCRERKENPDSAYCRCDDGGTIPLILR